MPKLLQARKLSWVVKKSESYTVSSIREKHNRTRLNEGGKALAMIKSR